VNRGGPNEGDNTNGEAVVALTGTPIYEQALLSGLTDEQRSRLLQPEPEQENGGE